MTADQGRSPRVFLSYRRRDSAGETGRLYDNLAARRPDWETFLDIDHIRPGENFPEEIDRFLSSCQLVVALVGRHWLNPEGSDGSRPIDSPNDMVRIELERAHALGVPVLPVLLGDARMPGPEDLPESFNWFSGVNAQRLSHESFERDLTVLMAAMESLVDTDQADRSVELVNRTRRGRTFRVTLRSQSHLVHFETRHLGANLVTVDGVPTGDSPVRDFGSRLTLNQQYSFALPDGPRSVRTTLDVRYLSDLLFVIGARVSLDGRTAYQEGRILY